MKIVNLHNQKTAEEPNSEQDWVPPRIQIVKVNHILRAFHQRWIFFNVIAYHSKGVRGLQDLHGSLGQANYKHHIEKDIILAENIKGGDQKKDSNY